MKITIERLATPIQSGDWHDPALKWAVNGPGDERQLFSTRAWARQYRDIRRVSPDSATASRQFALG